VAASAEEMSANVASVATGMEEASCQPGTVANATEEMTATIGEIAENSEKARGITQDATQQADRITAMMKQLGGAAQDIGKVTETITISPRKQSPGAPMPPSRPPGPGPRAKLRGGRPRNSKN